MLAPETDLSVAVLEESFGIVGGVNKFVIEVNNMGPSDAKNVVLGQKINGENVKFTKLVDHRLLFLQSFLPTSLRVANANLYSNL